MSRKPLRLGVLLYRHTKPMSSRLFFLKKPRRAQRITELRASVSSVISASSVVIYFLGVFLFRGVYFSMSDESFNPYAVPTTTTPEPSKPQKTGFVRMSDASLKTAIRLMVIAEVAFTAGWLFFISGMLTPLNFGFPLGEVAILGTVGSFFAAWVFIGILMNHCRGVGMLLVALVVPFPILGSVAFLACIIHARQKLIINGYTPGFLNAKPDKAERDMMDKNPYYVPSVAFDSQGGKRNLFVSLTQILVPLLALGFIALIGLG